MTTFQIFRFSSSQTVSHYLAGEHQENVGKTSALLRQIYEKTVELRKQHDAEAAEAAKATSRRAHADVKWWNKNMGMGQYL